MLQQHCGTQGRTKSEAVGLAFMRKHIPIDRHWWEPMGIDLLPAVLCVMYANLTIQLSIQQYIPLSAIKDSSK